MPARNIYHDAIVRALTADGWTITDDPLKLTYGGRDFYVDLGAERRTLAAEKEGRRIAVEVQSFLSPSPVRDMEEAIGQYSVYRVILGVKDPNRILYLAVSGEVFDTIFSERFGQLIMAQLELRILVFDEESERIIRWIE